MKCIGRMLRFVTATIAGIGFGMAEDMPHSSPHPNDQHTALYDRTCCDNQDCEPLPNEAVKITDKGYEVSYYSSRLGYVRDTVPFGSSKIKPSRGCVDGSCYHACAIPKLRPPLGGTTGQYIMDMNAVKSVRCLYTAEMF